MPHYNHNPCQTSRPAARWGRNTARRVESQFRRCGTLSMSGRRSRQRINQLGDTKPETQRTGRKKRESARRQPPGRSIVRQNEIGSSERIRAGTRPANAPHGKSCAFVDLPTSRRQHTRSSRWRTQACFPLPNRASRHCFLDDRQRSTNHPPARQCRTAASARFGYSKVLRNTGFVIVSILAGHLLSGTE